MALHRRYSMKIGDFNYIVMRKSVLSNVYISKLGVNHKLCDLKLFYITLDIS